MTPWKTALVVILLALCDTALAAKPKADKPAKAAKPAKPAEKPKGS